MILVSSADHGLSFHSKVLHPWSTNVCPMSSEAFAEGPSGLVASWESAERVYFSRINPDTLEAAPPIAAPGRPAARKHPSLAVNSAGETILVWAEGTGWARGGALAWQVFDAGGQPTAEHGRLSEGIPVWNDRTSPA